MTAFSLPDVPIIQAPMAGGITTPALVAAVAEAGAVGSFGFAYSTPEVIARDMAEARAMTNGLINANFFVFEPVLPPNEADIAKATERLCALPIALDRAAYDVLRAPFVPNIEAQFEALIHHAPDYLTFHFGLPPQEIMARAQAAGIMVGVTATCLEEAQAIAMTGADFIVAQGYEAGGHRGTFTALPKTDEALSSLSLTKAIAQWGGLPVITAGGIMTGADIGRALANGAAGVQMGTAFLCADEAGTAPSYKAALTSWHDRQTVMTPHFSGRFARALENTFVSEMTQSAFLPFPLQNTLTGPLRKKATQDGDAEFQSLWAGTGFQKIHSAPAAEIVKRLVDDLRNC